MRKENTSSPSGRVSLPAGAPIASGSRKNRTRRWSSQAGNRFKNKKLDDLKVNERLYKECATCKLARNAGARFRVLLLGWNVGAGQNPRQRTGTNELIQEQLVEVFLNMPATVTRVKTSDAFDAPTKTKTNCSIAWRTWSYSSSTTSAWKNSRTGSRIRFTKSSIIAGKNQSPWSSSNQSLDDLGEFTRRKWSPAFGAVHQVHHSPRKKKETS